MMVSLIGGHMTLDLTTAPCGDLMLDLTTLVRPCTRSYTKVDSSLTKLFYINLRTEFN